MNRAKQFTNFFHNFVVMKKRVNFLPENKRNDLNQLVDLIRQHIRDVGMIILYGSYARNTYVDYDQRIEFGVPTYFMSDYDLLILTRKPIGAVEYALYTKIKNCFYENKNRPFHTDPQFINYGIDDFNHALRKAHYFETEIKKQGIILYDSGEYKLERRRKLDYDEISERAQKYFDEKFGRALSFLRSTRHDIEDEDILMASFHLHQTTENLLRTVQMVFTLYGPKLHDLERLMDNSKKHAPEIYTVFPRNTPEEERLFKLLQRAYVESRYNPDFEITQQDVGALLLKVEQLRNIVEKACKDRIEFYQHNI